VYKGPLTGRIDSIVPFFPFSFGEQAVVAHKFYLRLVNQARKPIDLTEATMQLVGHCHLTAPGAYDTSVARHLAKDRYDSKLGARSLEIAVKNIKKTFVTAYRKYTDEEITEETNSGPLLRFDVQLHPGGLNKTPKIVVVENGVTHLPSDPEDEGKEERKKEIKSVVEKANLDWLSTYKGTSK
jgi:ATP-dependent Clp protease ATP-binding subunit ClpB